MPNFGPRLSDFDLESKVGEFVRAYICVSRGGDSSEQQKALRSTCAGLERMLAGLLQGSKGSTGWVDAISPGELSVRGCALWGEGSRGLFWMEPFPRFRADIREH
jgi:hypothetical protein